MGMKRAFFSAAVHPPGIVSVAPHASFVNVDGAPCALLGGANVSGGVGGMSLGRGATGGPPRLRKRLRAHNPPDPHVHPGEIRVLDLRGLAFLHGTGTV